MKLFYINLKKNKKVFQEKIIKQYEEECRRIAREKEQELIILYQINEEYIHLLFQRALKQREQKRLHISNQLAEENKLIIQRREEVLKHVYRISEQDLLKMHQIDEETQLSLLKRAIRQRHERRKRI